MSATADEFGQVLDKWQAENSMPWGQLRYHSTRRNIAKHVEDRPLRILDIGGGDGMDAIHYASLGHSVTLSDCSPTMLLEAKRAAEEQGVTERLRFIQTSLEAVPNLSHEQPFDLILCHDLHNLNSPPNCAVRNFSDHLIPPVASDKGIFSKSSSLMTPVFLIGRYGQGVGV